MRYNYNGAAAWIQQPRPFPHPLPSAAPTPLIGSGCALYIIDISSDDLHLWSGGGCDRGAVVSTHRHTATTVGSQIIDPGASQVSAAVQSSSVHSNGSLGLRSPIHSCAVLVGYHVFPFHIQSRIIYICIRFRHFGGSSTLICVPHQHGTTQTPAICWTLMACHLCIHFGRLELFHR